MFILIDFFLPCGASVTAVAYQVMLNCLEAIWHQRLGLIIQNVLLLHDNTRPHIDHAIFDLLGIWCWEYDPHPSYSRELSLHTSPHWAHFKNTFEVSIFHLTTKFLVLRWLQEQDICFYHQECHMLWLVPEQFCYVKTKGFWLLSRRNCLLCLSPFHIFHIQAEAVLL